MQKYIVEYWYYDRDEIADYVHLTVDASNKKEAISIAKDIAPRGSRSFKWILAVL